MDYGQTSPSTGRKLSITSSVHHNAIFDILSTISAAMERSFPCFDRSNEPVLAGGRRLTKRSLWRMTLTGVGTDQVSSMTLKGSRIMLRSTLWADLNVGHAQQLTRCSGRQTVAHVQKCQRMTNSKSGVTPVDRVQMHDHLYRILTQ